MQTIELRQDELLLKEALNDKEKEEIVSNLKNFKKKHFIVVGLGGVGSNCAELLVRSGCQNLTLIDADIIEIHNLGRQNYSYKQINSFKSIALKENLLQVSSKINIETINEYLSLKNYEDILLKIIKKTKKEVVILDCTDNLDSRNLINSFCLRYDIDWMYSGGEGYESICALFNYSLNSQSKSNSKTNSYNKLITLNHTQSANCSTGVLNSTTLITASLIVKELLFYYCLPQNHETKSKLKEGKIKCIKINSLHNRIFEFYI